MTGGVTVIQISLLFVLTASALPAAAAQTPTPRPKATKPVVVSPAEPKTLPRVFDSHGVELPWTPLADLAMPGIQGPIAVPFDYKFDYDFSHDFKYDFKFELPTLEALTDFPGLQSPQGLQGLQNLQGKLVPLPKESLFGTTWNSGAGTNGTFARLRPDQGTPEDSLYRLAREALNRGEYARSSSLFKSLEQRYPRSRVAPAALYYQAFALYRSGASEELRAAVEALKQQQEKYPEAAADPDAASLRTRIYAALAARGDQQAASLLRAASAAGPTCDKDDVEVRAEALNALTQLNPTEARATLKKVLARRDECSVGLRRRAVYLLGRSGTEEAASDLIEVAKTDPDQGVRSDAIQQLGRSAGNATVKTLETLFNESPDERTRQAALSALRSKGTPEARRVLRTIIERTDISDKMRSEAISQLASGSSEWDEASVRVAQTIELARASGATAARRPISASAAEEAAYLRGLYPKSDSRTVKSAIISAVARIGGAENEQWLLGIAKNKDEEMSMRREALSRLQRSALSVDDLSKLFESLSERDLRSAIINQLGNREEAAAVDKLFEIVKTGTDPQLRRQAIGILSRKNDPRTTKMLLELVERP